MEIRPTEFDIEFIERTQQLIKEYEGKNEFTFLINCLLGLIILPNEFNKEFQLKYLQVPLEDTAIINKCLKDSDIFIFNPTYFNKKKKKFSNEKKTLGCFLRKLRNALAHISSTKPINENGRWIGIKVKDINRKNNYNVELELVLKYEQIKIISEFISTEYQKEILKLV